MAATSDLICRPLPQGHYQQIIAQFGGADLTNGSWVSGGSVRKVWFDLPWMDQDIDYFFKSREAFDGFVQTISSKHDQPISASVDDPFSVDLNFKHSSLMSCYSTDNANTYTFDRFGLVNAAGRETEQLDTRFKIQAIKKYFPASLEELFGTFDFTVCQFATDGKVMVATKAAIDDCESNRLSMVPGTPRKISAIRVAKYCAYGFSPTDDMMETVITSLNNDEPMVLEDEY